MAKLNIAQWIDCTHSEGPGARFAVWLQGCHLHCHGCCNPQLWPFVQRTIISSRQLCRLIAAARRQHAELEGITLLGGEPFLQAVGLAEVAQWCRRQSLTVMVFSGFELQQLRRQELPGSRELLAATDLLADGPYLQQLLETERNWLGSQNQQLHFLTNAYQPGVEFNADYRRSFELRLAADGSIRINGWPVQLNQDSKT